MMSSPQYQISPQRFSSRSSTSSDTFSRAERRSFLDNSFDATQRPSSGASPYVDGRRNSSFVHPNLTSNNVFYDYEYAYKNDIPDPKVYSATKNPRRSVDSGSLSARYSSNNYDDDVYQPKTERQRRDLPVLDEEPEVEQSVKSCASSHGRYCPHCINEHMRNRKVDPTPSVKQQEREINQEWHAREEIRDTYNYDRERALRVIKAKEAQEEHNYRSLAYFKQMNEKRVSNEQGGMVIHSIFDGQEERTRQMKQMERNLRIHNFEQMVNSKREEDRSEGLNSSLQVGEGYSNRYLPHPDSVRAHVKKQVSENLANKMKQKEAEKRQEREMLEANARALEKEKQQQRQKVEGYRRMLTEQLAMKTQEKELAKEREAVEKQKTRYYAAQAIEEARNKDKHNYFTEKKNKTDYRQNLKEQELSNYRQKFEQKKKYYEGNGVSLNLGQKQLHDCDGCKKSYEKHHLMPKKHL